MSTDNSERGLERRICEALIGRPCDIASSQQDSCVQSPVPSNGTGWICGHPNNYDRRYTVDATQLLTFRVKSQPDVYETIATLEAVSLVEFELPGGHCKAGVRVNDEEGSEAYQVLQALGARLEAPQAPEGVDPTVH